MSTYQILSVDGEKVTVLLTADNGYQEEQRYLCSGGAGDDGTHPTLEAALKHFNSEVAKLVDAQQALIDPKAYPVVTGK